MMYVCMYASLSVCVCVSEPLGLELQAIVKQLIWVLGTEFRSFGRALSSQPPSVPLLWLLLFV